MQSVAIGKETDRRASVRKALTLIIDDIRQGLAARRPVIKPNFVSSSNQLASSHVDQIRGILDVVSTIYQGTITIAEAGCYDTNEAFSKFGYRALVDEYNVELLDLNRAPSRTVTILDRFGREIPISIAEMLLDKEHYRISAAKMKTHDTVVVTLSIKNLAVGSIAGACKKSIHQGVVRTNLNIADLARLLWPDLAVIDGYEGMEGDGPTRGDPVPLGLAVASTDALAADRIACEIMGVDFRRVGYLQYCEQRRMGVSDLAEIEVLGETLPDCIRPFRLHPKVREQYAWRKARESDERRRQAAIRATRRSKSVNETR